MRGALPASLLLAWLHRAGWRTGSVVRGLSRLSSCGGWPRRWGTLFFGTRRGIAAGSGWGLVWKIAFRRRARGSRALLLRTARSVAAGRIRPARRAGRLHGIRR